MLEAEDGRYDMLMDIARRSELKILFDFLFVK